MIPINKNFLFNSIKNNNVYHVIYNSQKNTSETERQASGKAVESSLKTFYKEFKKVRVCLFVVE